MYAIYKYQHQYYQIPITINYNDSITTASSSSSSSSSSLKILPTLDQSSTNPITFNVNSNIDDGVCLLLLRQQNSLTTACLPARPFTACILMNLRSLAKLDSIPCV